jgi:hypothetical protein
VAKSKGTKLYSLSVRGTCSRGKKSILYEAAAPEACAAGLQAEQQWPTDHPLFQTTKVINLIRALKTNFFVSVYNNRRTSLAL